MTAAKAKEPAQIEDKKTSAKMKERAKELDKEIGAYNSQERESAMSLGWAAAEMKRGNLWVYLGYDDEPSYRQAKNIGRATYFRYRRLAEGLCELDRKEFLKIKAENADHLIKLPEDKRYREDLIKKAQTLTEEEFEKAVVKFRAKEDKIDEGEVIVRLAWRMPESRRTFILESIDEFIKKHKLDADDQSRGLELICAEVRTGDDVRTRVVQDVKKLQAAHDLLNGKGKASNLSADEIMEKVHLVLAEHITGIARAAGLMKG
jgi:hypothetical protein